MEQQKNKSCLNCELYLPYYIWCNKKFRKTAHGFCAFKKLTDINIRKFPLEGCEHWQEQSNSTDEKIKQSFESLSEKLEFLYYYCNADEI